MSPKDNHRCAKSGLFYLIRIRSKMTKPGRAFTSRILSTLDSFSVLWKQHYNPGHYLIIDGKKR